MKVALLDSENVFTGEQEIDPLDFDPLVHIDAAEYGGKCDNEPGAYRWNRRQKSFEPMNLKQQVVADDVARIIAFAAEQAVYLKDPEIEPLILKHFPAEYRAASKVVEANVLLLESKPT